MCQPQRPADSVHHPMQQAHCCSLITRKATGSSLPARYNEVSLYNFSNPGWSSSAGHFTQVSPGLMAEWTQHVVCVARLHAQNFVCCCFIATMTLESGYNSCYTLCRGYPELAVPCCCLCSGGVEVHHKRWLCRQEVQHHGRHERYMEQCLLYSVPLQVCDYGCWREPPPALLQCTCSSMLGCRSSGNPAQLGPSQHCRHMAAPTT